MRRHRSLTLFAFALAVTSGCASSSTLVARNPLRGDDGVPLVATLDAAGCAEGTQDEFRVAVSSSRICVSLLRHALSAGGAAPSLSDAVTLTSDRTTRTIVLAPTGSSEVARCPGPDGAATPLVRVSHHGCAENDGFLTRHTSSLVLEAGADDAITWHFDHGHGRSERL